MVWNLVWNFLETIYGRCERDKDLWTTWYPVINTENRLYRKWLDIPGNEYKFKKTFVEFLRNEKFKELQKIMILELAISKNLTDQEANSVMLISIVKELVGNKCKCLDADDISSMDGPKYKAVKKNDKSQICLDKLKRKQSRPSFKDKAKKIGISLRKALKTIRQ